MIYEALLVAVYKSFITGVKSGTDFLRLPFRPCDVYMYLYFWYRL